MVKRRTVWAEHEVGRAGLGDERRTRRVVEVLGARGRRPEGALSESLGVGAGIKGGYRLYESNRIDAEAIVAAHTQRVVERIQQDQAPWILAIQDTTHVERRPQDAWVHSTLVARPDRVPYGLIEQQVWTRDEADGGKAQRRRNIAIEDKESMKWLKSIQAAGRLQDRLDAGQRVVSVGDRENDVFEALMEAQAVQVAVLIRAAQDRRIAEDDTQRLWGYVLSQPVAGSMQVEVQRNGTRSGRVANVMIRYTPVTVQPPVHADKTKALHPIQVWAIHVSEPNPPAEAVPIEWLLLTTVETSSLADAMERVLWYAARWLIEMFHKVLKSGCKIESRQLHALDTFKRYLVIDSIVAWRVLALTLLSRQSPSLPCSVLLAPSEWCALYALTHPTLPAPTHPPSLADATLWIAKLGGFMARQSDGAPGTLVIWRGLQRLADFTLAYDLFNHSHAQLLTAPTRT